MQHAATLAATHSRPSQKECTLRQACPNCNTLQHTATHCNTLHVTDAGGVRARTKLPALQHLHCSTLQHSATHCNTLQQSAIHCNILQHSATHCNTLQHIATHCNAVTAAHCHCLQHNANNNTATHCTPFLVCTQMQGECLHNATRCNTLHTRCNALQHNATRCNTLHTRNAGRVLAPTKLPARSMVRRPGNASTVHEEEAVLRAACPCGNDE